MTITHLCLGCFFPDGYSYQENMLPKYHKLQGHSVYVIASLQTFDENGHVAYMSGASKYTNENDVQVIRLDYRSPVKVYKKLKRFIGTYKAIEDTNPDILFIHGCQFLDIDVVVKYLKSHPSVKVFVDNHADFSNSATNYLSLNILHKVIWKHCANLILPYTSKFYGVLPARVDFLKNVYGLPESKVELLVMGADDQKVQQALKPENIKSMRELLKVNDSTFLIMTGGKIDLFKKQILLLMDAVNQLNNHNIKLIVFGSIVPEMKEEVNKRCSEYVSYIGWVNSNETDKYFAAADLVVFPGRHSVFWEQVCGLGIPMLCKKWDGTTHVDVGGNVIFLEKDSQEEIYDILKNIIIDKPERYRRMKQIACEKGKEQFSYDKIAERSIREEVIGGVK